MIKALSVSLLSAALLVAAPAHAQSRRELAQRLDAVEARIAEVEGASLAGDPVADTLMRRLDELDYQVRELTGEVERLAFENRQLRQQLEDVQRSGPTAPQPGVADPAGGPADLDDEAVTWMREGLDEAPRGEAGENGPVAIVDPGDPHGNARAAATGVLGAPSSMAPEGAEMPADPSVLYEDAHARLMDGDFGGAQAGFERFVGEYPDDARTGEAWYWLGETFFVRSDFADAADAYIASLRARPNGEKAPDALVRLAASLHGMGRQDEACATLARFGSQFPNASAASRARATREAVRAGCQ